MKYILKNIRQLKYCLISILLFSEFGALAQQDFAYTSHATYWYYRSRLRNDFLLVGSGNGMSIPMQQRGFGYTPYTTIPLYYNFDPMYGPGQCARWGDAMSDLGYYIGTLATEYALLKINSQSVDSTLKELYYALWAINRMDYNGEVLYKKVNTLYGGTPSYDGFLCRDDVETDFVSNNFVHFNYYGSRGFCSNIQINNSKTSPGDGPYATSWSAAYNGLASVGQDFHGSFISQDNWYNILIGLSLVRKLVPPNESYKIAGVPQKFQANSQDANVSSLYAEARNLADRVYNYFIVHRSLAGFLEYPSGAPIPEPNGGLIGPLSFAHSEIVGRIEGMAGWDYYNPTESNGQAFHDLCAVHAWENPPPTTGFGHQIYDAALSAWRQTVGYGLRAGLWSPIPHCRSCGLPYTGKIHEGEWRAAVNNNHSANVDPMYVNLQALCNCWYNFVENDGAKVMGFDEYDSGFNLYHGQLLRAVLDGWESCSYGEANSFPSTEMTNTWNQLLSSAPCEPQITQGGFTFHTSGPYSFKSAADGPPNPFFEWSTTSRMDHPQRRGLGNNSQTGEYNGLDYMLYHNLYFLLRRASNNDNSDYIVDFSNRNLTLPYPLTGNTNTSSSNPWGSITNPATVGAYEVINTNSTFNNNSVVNLVAGKEIQWGNNFSAILGCQLGCNIQHLDCSSIFNQDNNYDNVNARTTSNNNSNTNHNYAAMPTSFDSSVIKKDIVKSVPVKATTKQTYASLPLKKLKEDANFANNASVYPNPNNGLFILQINNPSSVKTFEIQDMLGQIIHSSDNNILNANNIDISSFKPGIYCLRLTDINGKICVKKIVKN